MACNHNCSSCSDSSCKDRDFTIKPKEGTIIKKIIAVTSGKGGVGKSLVTSLLAVAANKQGLKVGILDADVTGPSIPKSFGLTENDRAQGSEDGLFPVVTKSGIKMMSINLLLEDPTQPVVWRGPVISGVVKQFYTDVLWGELDVLFIDMPPGTGDVPLTVFQSLKIDGIVVVTTPQELVSLIVEKSVKMAEIMNVPVLGIIENMSYFKCPDCDKKLYVFGKGKTDEVAKKYGVSKLLEIPIDEGVRTLVDSGEVELADVEFMNNAINKIMENKNDA